MDLGGMARHRTPELCPAQCLACGRDFFCFCFERVEKGEPGEGSRSECGKGSRGDRICAPRSPAGERGEGFAELWDVRGALLWG